MQIEFSQQIFEKYSNVKFRENPPIGNQVSCGQTGRETGGHDNADGRFSQLCERG